MDIIPICEREHREILSGTCPWCQLPILNGKVASDEAVFAQEKVRLRKTLSTPASLDGVVQAVYDRLMQQKLDLSRVSDVSGSTLRRELRLVIERVCDNEYPSLAATDRDRIVDQVLGRVIRK